MKKSSRQKTKPVVGKGFAPSAKKDAPGTENIMAVIVCILLAAAVIAVFGQTLRHGFVNFDDNEYVYENPEVTGGLTVKGIVRAFTHVHASNWHPVTTMSHMLDCQIYGVAAGGHHLTNVLLHAAAAVVLFLALREMTGSLCRSAFVAAVFAIHPLHVESVAWVSERKDVLSGLFFMLTLLAYARYVRVAGCGLRAALFSYMRVVLFFALGLMSKPMLVTLPFVLILLDYWPLGRLGNRSQVSNLRAWPFPLRVIRCSRFQVFIEKLPLFALSAASCVATVLAQTEAIQPWVRIPLFTRIGNALVAYGVYVGKTIWPSNLAVLYPMQKGGWPVGQVIAATALLGALTMWALLRRRERPYLLTGWLWYLGMLAPVIGIMQVGGQAYADRYTYLPQIGLCLAGTWLAADWAGERRWRRAALAGVAVPALVALMVVSAVQTHVWRDSIALWTHALERTRDNGSAHYNLGNVLRERGQSKEAIVHYRAVLEIAPDYAEARNNLGNALRQEGRVDDAMARYREAFAIKPDYAEAHYNLGLALFQLGRTEEALAQYREALKIKPDYAEARNNLGNALLQQGKTDEAMVEYREALRLQPESAEAHNNIGSILFQQGNTEQATAEFREALRIDPAFVEAYSNLGNIFFRQGEQEEAIAQYRAALKIKPAFVDALNNLGSALLQRGQPEEAIAQYRKALKIKPTFAEAHYNVALAVLQLGRSDEAIEPLQRALGLQPGNVAVRNTLAWVLATASPANLRDGAQAVQLASQVNAATGGTNPVSLRTLAAAQAEAGDFPSAVQTAQAALQKAEAEANVDLASKLRREIALYEAGKPFPEGR